MNSTTALDDEAPNSADKRGIMSRQPILNDRQEVVGYELFNRLPGSAQHSSESDATLLFTALTLEETQALGEKQLLFISCTHAGLRSPHLELVQPEHAVIKLPPAEGHAPQAIEECAATIAELAEKGFRFAFDHSALSRNYAAWRPFASFVRLNRQDLKADMVEPLVRYARQHTQAQLIASRIETEEQFTEMRRHDIQLFQGYWFARPVQLKAQRVRPSQLTAIQLIEKIRGDAETAELEELLKSDPTLSFTLLKYINSSGFGLNQVITSFGHAVMLLGRQRLLRWAALLLTLTRPDGPPAAVGLTAIVRGRLMELLAREAGCCKGDECDTAFVVGVFSLLDTLVGVRMEEVLPTLHLPGSVAEALLHQRGAFAPLLELTLACEAEDAPRFAELALQLKLSNRQINWSHVQALAWAQNLLG